jgi:formylglycine-generating enzyme required for sulfatase activity
VYSNYPVADTENVVQDGGDTKSVEEKESRVLRGATFLNLSEDVRSAGRNGNRPGYRANAFGVRPARTYY